MERGIRILVLTLLMLGVISAPAKTRKALYIILDGVAPDNLERLQPKTIFDVAKTGAYSRAFCGGRVGTYTETPTISAIGYTSILTGTWMNKHNVRGNGNIKINYNYWSLFRIAKAQKRDVKTAIFSSWTDNRTILLGAGKSETGNLKVDYVFDGYDQDKEEFPKKGSDLQIFDIDCHVCEQAARCVREQAPDLSWVYLWYTDDAYHLYGNGAFSDEYVRKTDEQIGKIWEAIKYREKNFDEDWLLIITTDHGRNDWGFDHGGQSERERTVWMATNQKKVGSEFRYPWLSHVDICPTICDWMDFVVPQDVAFEQDGISFLGKRDIYDLRAYIYEYSITLNWKTDGSKEMADIYMAMENNFKTGGKDEWTKVGSVPVRKGSFKVDISAYRSPFYKFVVQTRNNRQNIWVNWKPNARFAPEGWTP